MQNDKPNTTEERRLKRIAMLKARLQKEEARLSSAKRKARNGQLIAWGVMVEEIFKNSGDSVKNWLISSAKKHLKDKTLQKSLDGFSRLGGKIDNTGQPSRGDGDAHVADTLNAAPR